MKDICGGVISLLTLGSMLLSAQTTPPPTTSFFPLSEIHRGLRGVAYTVFEGTQPEPMDVEILGVLHDAIGPKQDMILARLHGTKPEYTGVVAGMSGSPVYIDGKLVGALAYRIGQFSKEPIAGITPIEEMLEVRDQGLRNREQEIAGIRGQGSGRRAQGAESSSLIAASGPSKSALDDKISGSELIQPMDTPLVFTGFSPEALTFWKEHASGSDLQRLRALGARPAMKNSRSRSFPVQR